MMIKTTFIEKKIELSHDYVRCIEIENKSYFYRLIDSLNKVSNGEVLDELSLDEMKQNNMILILDYLNFSENFKKISNDIQKLIKEKIDEVAEKARIDEKHYGRIERNVCEPKICTIVEIGKALEIEPWIIVKRAQGL